MSCIQKGRFVPTENKFVDEQGVSNLRTPVRKGTLLISRSNTDELVGAVCFVDRDVPHIFLSDLIWEVSGLSDSVLNIKWLSYLLCSNYYRARIVARANGTSGSMKKITKPSFLGLKIPIPPVSEQKKIAEILSTWDAAIEQTRMLINAKKRLKKALMQQLLTGKKRFPGFAKTKDRKFYRFFDLPTDWKCPKIREVAEESSERNRQRDKLTVLSCSKHLGFVVSSEYFGKQIFSEDTSNYKVIRRDCFGYPSNHIEEGSIGLLTNHDIGLVSPIYTVFKCNEKVVPEFLYAIFKTDTYRHIFSISTNASVDRRDSLRWRMFSLIHVPNPTKEEQLAIVDVLKTVDDNIILLEKKFKTLEKQKRGLMQKLLTGEIRVK